MSVVMATFMISMIPRASVSADRIQEVLDTEPSVVPPGRPGRATSSTPRRARVPRRRLPLPGRRAPGADATSPSRPRPGRRPRSSAAPARARPRSSTSSRACSTPPRARCWSAASTCATSTPTCCGARIGLVPQRPYLFSGTVASNLHYGKPDATEDEMWEALEVAQAADFVRGMPGGLDARIEQGGTNVSGGQRQRLSIARALVRKPEIYLFDDSFSALDLATDARLRAALGPVHRATPPCSSWPSGCRRSPPPTRSSCSRTASSSGSGTARRADRRAARPTPRSCSRRSARRGGGMTLIDDRRRRRRTRRGARPRRARDARRRPLELGRRARRAVEGLQTRSRRLVRHARPERVVLGSSSASSRSRAPRSTCSGPACSATAPTSSSSGVTSHQGIDFGALHHVLFQAVALYAASSALLDRRAPTCSPASSSG